MPLTFSLKMSEAETKAKEAIGKLEAAAHKFSAGKIPEWICRTSAIFNDKEATPKELAKSAHGVSSFLCRGEWDRLFVERGDLSYRDLALIELAMLEYCETLELDPDTRMGVEIIISRLRHRLATR
jgi:hypothetical protein